MWCLMIFECVACRVFAFVGMSGCLKNIQKTRGFGTIFEHRPFCMNMRFLRNVIEDEAEIGLVCSLILEDMSD